MAKRKTLEVSDGWDERADWRFTETRIYVKGPDGTVWELSVGQGMALVLRSHGEDMGTRELCISPRASNSVEITSK